MLSVGKYGARQGLFVVFISLIFSLRAQNSDSLTKALAVAKNDTNKVLLLTELGWKAGRAGAFEEALKYNESAFELSKTLGFKKGMAMATGNSGTVFLNKGEYKTSLDFYRRAEQFFMEIKHRSGEANMIANQGGVYYVQGFYPKALEYFFRALRIREQIADSGGIGATYNNIANVYGEQEDYDKALSYHFRSLELAKSRHKKFGQAQSYTNIGEVYRLQEKYHKALDHLSKAIQLYTEIDHKQGLSGAYNNMASTYAGLGDSCQKAGDAEAAHSNYALALKNDQIALAIREEIGNGWGMAVSYENMAEDYRKLGDPKRSMTFGLKALEAAKKIEALEVMKNVSLLLSELKETQKEYKPALIFYRQYVVLRDSIYNEESTKKQVRLEMNYEFEKKEAQARAEQEKKEAIAEAEKKKQRFVLTLVSCFLLLVAGFAVFAYRSFLQKKRANEEISRQKEVIEEKQKEILDSIYYARRIQRSLLTSEKYILRSLIRLKKTGDA